MAQNGGERLDGGMTVHLRAGDVVIVRGCRHTWMNRSDRPAVTAFVLIDAEPVPSTSGPLAVEFPRPTLERASQTGRKETHR